MSPLPEHGRNASLVADTIKAILDYLGKEYDSFTPITMKLPQRSGIEPDCCFYIDNWQAVSGKKRINWEVDPAPDLVIEIDLTSYTDVNDYLVYQVPEVWLFKSDRVTIYRLQNDSYLVNNRSCYFPDLDVLQLIADCFKVASDRNTSVAIRQLRQKLNEIL
jgi:Uma2 family endonuclease